MSRFSGGGSKGHRIETIGPNHFRLSWSVDRYVKGSRLRFPRGCTRDTDRAGAERFAKRWNIQVPVPKEKPAPADA